MPTRAPDAVTALLLEAIGALEQEQGSLTGRVAADTLLGETSQRKARALDALVDAFRSLPPADRASHTALAKRARELNDLNARLLAARVVGNRARVSALVGAAATTYGANGESAAPARFAGATVLA